MPYNETLYRIVSAYFVAGLVTDHDDRATRAAPIIKYMIGWQAEDVRAYCLKKKWKLEVLGDD